MAIDGTSTVSLCEDVIVMTSEVGPGVPNFEGQYALRIEGYALVGDRETAALVGRELN